MGGAAGCIKCGKGKKHYKGYCQKCAYHLTDDTWYKERKKGYSREYSKRQKEKKNKELEIFIKQLNEELSKLRGEQ